MNLPSAEVLSGLGLIYALAVVYQLVTTSFTLTYLSYIWPRQMALASCMSGQSHRASKILTPGNCEYKSQTLEYLANKTRKAG